jgi:hypothetical protein
MSRAEIALQGGSCRRVSPLFPRRILSSSHLALPGLAQTSGTDRRFVPRRACATGAPSLFMHCFLLWKMLDIKENNTSSRRVKGNTMKKPVKKVGAEGKIIFSVRLDVDERVALEKAAKADDRTAAAVVRRLIRDFLKDRGLLK